MVVSVEETEALEKENITKSLKAENQTLLHSLATRLHRPVGQPGLVVILLQFLGVDFPLLQLQQPN